MNNTASSPWIPRSRQWLFLMLFTQLISALLGSYQIWSAAGWPANHEVNAFALRAVYTAEEFWAGNFFSIWSIHENYGLGSPLALFYPRLFSVVAALGIVAGLSVKAALVGAVLFFGVLGGGGLYGALRELQLSRSTSWILSLCFIHLNYVQTDLIPRGAMAEFSMIALTPFLLWWSLRLVRRGEFSWWIIPLWMAIFFAHTTLMGFAVAIPLTAGVIALITHPDRRRRILLRALLAGALLSVLLLPYFLLVYAQRKFFLFEIGYLRFLNPRYFFYSFGEHIPLSLLAPPRYPINPWYPPGLLLGLLAASATLGCLWFRHRPAVSREICKRRGLFALLLLPLGWYLFLQDRISWPLYLTSDFFIVLQFPWRLQTFSTLLLLLLLGLLLKMLRGKIPAALPPTAAILTATLIVGGSLGAQLRYPGERIAPRLIAAPAPINWLEYTPILPKFRDKVDSDEFRLRTANWIKDYAGRSAAVEGTPPRRLEYRELPLGVMVLTSEADRPYVLTVRSAWSNLALVTLDTPGENARLATWRTREDPRLRFAVPAGVHQITVRPPLPGNFLRRLTLPERPPDLP